MKLTQRVLFILCFTIIFTLSFCNKSGKGHNEIAKAASGKYFINGTISNFNGGKIYIAHFDTLGKIARVDSTRVQDGYFKFHGKISNIEECSLGIKYNGVTGFMGVFILDSGNLTINCDAKSIEQLNARGTKGQDEYNLFAQKNDKYIQGTTKLYNLKLKAQKKHDQKLIDSIQKASDVYKQRQKKDIMWMTKTYPSSIVTALIVNEYYLKPDKDTLQQMYALFTVPVKQSWYGKRIFRALQFIKRTAINDPLPGFVLPDKNGKQVSLHSYLNKWVLVDFWASWCSPCRKENPNLVRLYKMYKNKNFEMISISLDDDKNAWLNAVKRDNLSWIQLCGLKDQNSNIKSLYNIREIPVNFLLDGKGKIIAKNLTGNDLQNELAKILQ